MARSDTDHCKNHSPDGSECYDCILGYEYDISTSDSAECVKCDTVYCISCQYTVCSECRKNYYLNSNYEC